MTRQEKLKEIGNMHLSEYSSKFIIPVPHKFYENNVSIFENIKESGWEIENATDNVKLGAYNIKSYIYGNMIPKFNQTLEQTFLDTSRTLLLKNKVENLKVILKDLRGKAYELILKDMHLWIFEEHIAFFVLSIDIIDRSKYTINQINDINNIVRSFKLLELVQKADCISLSQCDIRDGEKDSFLGYLLGLTHIKDKNKSFLNMEKCDCIEKNNKNNKINELYSIYNASVNAKLLLGMQTSTTHYSDDTPIEEDYEECIGFNDTMEMSILSEIPYYLATCTPFDPKNDWTSNDEYIYRLVNVGGFNIWKYSAGLTIHDSSAFIGLENDGGPIVNNVNSNFYFIYILNLYINLQIGQIGHNLIDQHFESTNINYWYRKLQILKNQFLSDDVGIKFQENELNRSMFEALKTKNILSEVSSNIVETKSITKRHTGIYITLVGFIIIYLFEGDIKECFSSIDKKFLLLVAVPAFYFLVRYRNKIRKVLKL